MANINAFSIMVEETKALVQEKMQQDKLPDYTSRKQLHLILNELDKMEQIRSSHLFAPYYPRAIVDSWDFSDPLAIRLMELSKLYRALK